MNSRRNFFRIAGVGLTGSLIQPIQLKANFTDTKSNRLSKYKIGVLLPQSLEQSNYSESFLNGLVCGIYTYSGNADNQFELITESVKSGSPGPVIRKAEKLVYENNADVIIGLINPEVAIQLDDILKQSKVPALIVNSGENYLRNQQKDNPYLFFNTLGLFQTAYLTGRHAVTKHGQNIAVVTSLADFGYDALDSFRLGVESKGGQITEIYFNKHDDSNYIDETISKLEKSKPDCIYAFLHGNLSDEFFRSIKLRGLNTPVLANSFALEDRNLRNLGNAASEIENFCSWNKNLNNPENHKFVEVYRTKFSKEPDQFSVLGYESGQIIQKSLQSNFDRDFAGSLRNTIIQSPRGEVWVSEKSGMVQHPVYLCKTLDSGLFSSENVVVGEYKAIKESEDEFASFETELRSGYTRPYLIT